MGEKSGLQSTRPIKADILESQIMRGGKKMPKDEDTRSATQEHCGKPSSGDKTTGTRKSTVGKRERSKGKKNSFLRGRSMQGVPGATRRRRRPNFPDNRNEERPLSPGGHKIARTGPNKNRRKPKSAGLA